VSGYLSECYRKTRFRSRSRARRRARQIRGEGGPDLHAYRCRYCPHVHLGHKRGLATHLRDGPYGPVPVQELTA
jgi:hypothetical protein